MMLCERNGKAKITQYTKIYFKKSPTIPNAYICYQSHNEKISQGVPIFAVITNEKNIPQTITHVELARRPDTGKMVPKRTGLWELNLSQ